MRHRAADFRKHRPRRLRPGSAVCAASVLSPRRRRSAFRRTSRRSWPRTARPATARPRPRAATRSPTTTWCSRPATREAAAVTAGKPDESELLPRVSSDDESMRMPQEADPLPAEQVALVKRWIAEGAKYDGADPAAPLASIMPKTAQPDPPASLSPAGADRGRGLQPRRPGAGRRRLPRSDDLERGQRRAAAADQERAGARAIAGLQPRRHAAGRGRRNAGQLWRSETVQSGRRHAGEGPGLDGRRGLSGRVQSGRHEAGRRRGRSLDPRLRRRQRQARDPDRGPRRLGRGPGLELPTARGWPRPAATKPRSCSTPRTANR